MARYTFLVCELVCVPRYYTVAAASEEEARDKAEAGDTVSEDDCPSMNRGIVERTIEELVTRYG